MPTPLTPLGVSTSVCRSATSLHRRSRPTSKCRTSEQTRPAASRLSRFTVALTR